MQIKVVDLFFTDHVETIPDTPLIQVFAEIRPGGLIDIGGKLVKRNPYGIGQFLRGIVGLKKRLFLAHQSLQLFGQPPDEFLIQ